MARNVEISMLTGPIRCGKTYTIVSELVEDLLPNTELKVVTNLPLNLERLYRYCQRVHGGILSDWEGRVELLPEPELQKWRVEESSPLEFFAQRGNELTGKHLIIDELHNFCGRGHSKKHVQKWSLFLGEIGHSQASAEFISQAPDKVARVVHDECHRRRELLPSSIRSDPFFGIKLDEWYEVRAGVISLFRGKKPGNFVPNVFVRHGHLDRGKFVQDGAKMVWITGKYFGLYDSFAAPIAGGGKAEGSRKREFERRSFPSLLVWFFDRHWLAFIAAWKFWVPIVLLCGGGGWVINRFFEGAVHGFVGGGAVHSPVVRGGVDSRRGDRLGAVPVGGAPLHSVSAPVLVSGAGGAPAVVRQTPSSMPAGGSGSGGGGGSGGGRDGLMVTAVTAEGVCLKNGEFWRLGETREGEQLCSVSVRDGRCYVGSRCVFLGQVVPDRKEADEQSGRWSVARLPSRPSTSPSQPLNQ